MDKTAVKSMLTLALSLVLLIGIWSLIAHIAYPGEESGDQLLTFVTSHEPMLAQIAEAAMDDTRWPGLMETQEVQELLKEGSVEAVEGYAEHAIFTLKSPEEQEGRLLLYFPEGVDPDTYLNNDANAFNAWAKANGATVNTRKLTERFYLVDVYIPQ